MRSTRPLCTPIRSLISGCFRKARLTSTAHRTGASGSSKKQIHRTHSAAAEFSLNQVTPAEFVPDQAFLDLNCRDRLISILRLGRADGILVRFGGHRSPVKLDLASRPLRARSICEVIVLSVVFLPHQTSVVHEFALLEVTLASSSHDVWLMTFCRTKLMLRGSNVSLAFEY